MNRDPMDTKMILSLPPKALPLLPLLGLLTACGDFEARIQRQDPIQQQDTMDRRIQVEVADVTDRNIELPPAWQDDPGNQPAEEVTPAENPEDPEAMPAEPPTEDIPEIPQAGELCAPCNSGQDCGGAEDLCLQNSETMELFCGQRCDQVSGCPAGFTCRPIGASGQDQCVPDTETCGGGQSTPDPGSTTGDCGNAYESEVLNRVNAERAKYDLAPLACDPVAAQVAHAYSQYMCDAGFFSHTGQDGSTPMSRLQAAGAQFSGAGENIAAGQPTPASVMQGWMQSSGHRSNILNSMWTHLGVGYVKCGAYDTRWTQSFLRK